MKLAPLLTSKFDPTMCTSETNNTSCIIYRIKYSSRRNYLSHVQRCHKNGDKTPIKRHSNIAANLDSRVQPIQMIQTFTVSHVKEIHQTPSLRYTSMGHTQYKIGTKKEVNKFRKHYAFV